MDMTSNSYQIEGLSYEAVFVSGLIKIPQSGKYEFRAIGTSSIKLNINYIQVGSVSQDYSCNTPETSTTDLISFPSLAQGDISFELTMAVPCSLYVGEFTLQWKNYAHNSNSEDTIFEDIPIKYLGK